MQLRDARFIRTRGNNGRVINLYLQSNVKCNNHDNKREACVKFWRVRFYEVRLRMCRIKFCKTTSCRRKIIRRTMTWKRNYEFSRTWQNYNCPRSHSSPVGNFGALALETSTATVLYLLILTYIFVINNFVFQNLFFKIFSLNFIFQNFFFKFYFPTFFLQNLFQIFSAKFIFHIFSSNFILQNFFFKIYFSTFFLQNLFFNIFSSKFIFSNFFFKICFLRFFFKICFLNFFFKICFSNFFFKIYFSTFFLQHFCSKLFLQHFFSKLFFVNFSFRCLPVYRDKIASLCISMYFEKKKNFERINSEKKCTKQKY